MSKGSLACVGLGMTLGAHLAPRARSFIEKADVVFAAVSDPLVELWVQEMHRDVRSLQPYYGEGKPRNLAYREMVAAMLVEVRAGKQVCGAFYGHPGVFACVPHMAISRAKEEGFDAVMEAAVSAEDCLYADLGIDPGTFGCQHYEASQFMFYRRRVDPSAYLILWQVGIAGDPTLTRVGTGDLYREVLLELLAADYPLDHDVIAYEAATLPLYPPRMEHMLLRQLPHASLNAETTLVIPPGRSLEPNLEVTSRLSRLAEEEAGLAPL
ncbi:SAM-dependent methyltransferase [Pseudoxanthomonas putridarboris]|uniref:SAM-dependent methyltransferase n=1 Tax=Pseudoxanthomonas putridarboris TaxID=752605 RepID=A0ABU9J0D4_9GAMM